MKVTKLSRRSVLRGLLAGAAVNIGLPPLEVFLNSNGTGYAATGPSGFPRRFAMFYWGNGHLAERWVPEQKGQGMDWELSDQLQPLSGFKEKMTLVTGLNVPFSGTGQPHFETACLFMCGKPLFVTGGDWTFSGNTFDQVLADAIGGETRFKSLEFGVDNKRRGLSYRGPNNHVPAEASPFAFFERVFGGSFSLPGENAVPDPRLAVERSVLDAVLQDISELKTTVGAADKIRLEGHFEGIRAIEQQLSKLQLAPPDFEGCAYPTQPQAEYLDQDGMRPYELLNGTFSEIAAYAMACDQTRVVSNWFSAAVQNSLLYPGLVESHHSLTHFESEPQDGVHECMLFCMARMAQFLEKLDAIPEGDGTLLDHMVVLGTSDCASGKLHSGTDFPTVMVGSADGALLTDIHWRSEDGDNATRVPLTIARSLGVDLASYGEGDIAAVDSISEIQS